MGFSSSTALLVCTFLTDVNGEKYTSVLVTTPIFGIKVVTKWLVDEFREVSPPLMNNGLLGYNLCLLCLMFNSLRLIVVGGFLFGIWYVTNAEPEPVRWRAIARFDCIATAIVAKVAVENFMFCCFSCDASDTSSVLVWSSCSLPSLMAQIAVM